MQTRLIGCQLVRVLAWHGRLSAHSRRDHATLHRVYGWRAVSVRPRPTGAGGDGAGVPGTDRSGVNVYTEDDRLIPSGRQVVEIMGDETVEIDKMYGPLVFWGIRVTPRIDTCEWVVEREYGPEGEWREVCRIPGQLESDFADA